MIPDWTPTSIDPARRLVQVRMALEVLHRPNEDREGMEELALNLERKFIPPQKWATKGK